ncbi:MAG: aconitate hydratase [Armatimonadetes bacterium]|nr:aconitate hydratase [Armatimonadota bacterium]
MEGDDSVKKTLTAKIIEEHLVSGKIVPGEEIGIKIDQTLTQDATGTMAYLQFEAMGIPRVRTKRSVSYVDHNMLQTGFENADDHRYLQTVAAKYGIVFSRPGNGICHQVHRERFAVPGQTLLGSDSHTPTAGALGMLAIGVGGLDVAVAMGGGPYYLRLPRVVGVRLTGALRPWVSGKDVILELLRRLTVKGGVGKILEYFGDGLRTLRCAERFTITNMGAELGATTSIFPSDEETRGYLAAQGRSGDFRDLSPDEGASYDEILELDLSNLEPLIACPHSPDSVRKVREIAGTHVDQVCIGSCTNSSYEDLMTAAAMLKGKVVHPRLSMTVTPGSKQVYEMIAREGALADLIASGCRILESGCGPCIGMGQAPPSGGVTIRSFNRNFEGRSGTLDAKVYLASPEVCVACALKGEIADPRDVGIEWIRISTPAAYLVRDDLLVHPPADSSGIEVLRGPNIKPLPTRGAIEDRLTGEVLLKVGDNITTDHIMPAGSKVLPLRSNIPAISEYVYERVDPGFSRRAREKGGGVVVGGDNYGQGSSREHAALAPMYLGIKWVLARSFARIHRTNLINFGILPLLFADLKDYENLEQGDVLEITSVRDAVRKAAVQVRNTTRGNEFSAKVELSEREGEVLLAGGLLNYTKQHSLEAV